jgi:hypothetical protein
MLMPLRWIGLGPLTDIVEPALRVLVELGYDRGAPPGQVVRAGLFPKLDTGKLAADLGAAFAEGGAALRDVLRLPSAVPAAVPALATAAAESNRISARRGGVTAQVSRRLKRIATKPTSSKVSTVRIHPADAA